MPKINTVFFDWGGVVASDPGDDFLAHILEGIGATDEQITEVLGANMKRFMCGQISENEFWQEVESKIGLVVPDTISDEFMKWSGLVASQDVIDLVDEIRNAGLKTAVLSNVIEPTYDALAEAGYYDLFDEVIASCKVGYAKPEKDIYQLSLRRLNTEAETSLFIDDKQRNLDAALEMGFKIVIAKNPAQTVRDVRMKLS